MRGKRLESPEDKGGVTFSPILSIFNARIVVLCERIMKSTSQLLVMLLTNENDNQR